MNDMINKDNIPAHIAIIMDGNGRWAKNRFLPKKAGHRKGAKVLEDILKYSNSIGIKFLTAYAFSTENWKRPKDEVDDLMDLFHDYLNQMLDNIHRDNIRMSFIGDRTVLADKLQYKMQEIEDKTKVHTGLHALMAINYGGRDEIVHAFKSLYKDISENNRDINSIKEQDIENYMYTAGIPSPDLIIRPSGEQRLSNFLIWQAAYSEFYYTNILWPDFKPEDLDKAIIAYQNRDRRFGGR